MWPDMPDAIVEVEEAHREALAAEHGHDLKAVVVALGQKRGADGWRVVSFAAKPEPAKPARESAG